MAWAAQLQAHGIPLVGTIPQGIHILPALSAQGSSLSGLFTGGVIIALLGFMETITVGRRFATMRNYRININNELIALGACNLVGSGASMMLMCVCVC